MFRSFSSPSDELPNSVVIRLLYLELNVNPFQAPCDDLLRREIIRIWSWIKAFIITLHRPLC